MPSTVDDRLVKIIGQNTDCGVERAWKNSSHCPLYSALDHVSVISLEKDHFGEIYDYCAMFPPNICAMEISSEQASPDARATALDKALELNPPARFGGFLLMAAVSDFYLDRTSERRLIEQHRQSLAAEGRAVLVEAVLYVDPEAVHPAISIPLFGELNWIKCSGTIPGPYEQPVLSQVFPYFNPYKPSTLKDYTSFDKYDADKQTFIPARFADAFPIDFSPWRFHATLLRVSGVDMTMHLFSRANGSFKMDPMCAMKHKFIRLKWVWPQWPADVPKPRKVMDTKWRIVKEPDGAGKYTFVARPQLGAAGCRWALDGTLVRKDDKDDGSESDKDDGSESDVGESFEMYEDIKWEWTWP